MSARQAIELIDHGERFDVILSDLMMPEMTGMDFHAALLRSAPDQAGKMVFMSGGAFSPNAFDVPRSDFQSVDRKAVQVDGAAAAHAKPDALTIARVERSDIRHNSRQGSFGQRA